MRRLRLTPKNHRRAIFNFSIWLLVFGAFGYLTIVIWNDVPARDALHRVSGIVTRVEAKSHKYGSHVNFWIDGVQLYYRSASLARHLRIGTPIEAWALQYRPSRPALHVYELRSAGRVLVNYEKELQHGHRIALFPAALSIGSLVVGLFSIFHSPIGFKAIETTIAAHRLVVENTWFDSARLFHNGMMVALNKRLLFTNPEIPIMSENILIDGKERKVEVFALAIVTVKLQIRVDGKYVAGDRFNL